MIGLSISKRAWVLAVVLLVAPAALAESAARYEAVFVDGTRIEGDKVFGWGEHPVSPRLDSTALSDAKRPLRWLRDRKVKLWRPGEYCPGYIEFIGGDRLVGRIVGVGAGAGPIAAAHLLVKPAFPLHQPISEPRKFVRVLPGRIRRVVFGPVAIGQLDPGTLYYRDGRHVGFVHLRWQEESVVLLLKGGTSEVSISDIAEVHLPKVDPWDAYYRELAILSPACRSRMMRIETTGGLIATGSSLRFGALAYGARAQQRAVVARLKQLGERLAGIEGTRKANKLKLDRARAKYHGQLADSDKQAKADRQTYQKAVVEMRQRIDGLRKADSAELTKQREQLTRDMRAADQAMEKQLAKTPPDKRDKMLETFRAKQAQLRKSREKSLEDQRGRIETRRKQKEKEFERFIGTAAEKLQRQAKERQEKLADTKRGLEAETLQWKKFLAVLESARSQYASVRGGRSETWSHIVQPVWSLDPLWVPFRSIRMRWSFAPARVPLCRIQPAAKLNPPFLPARTNRGFAGGPLRSGGDEYAWGFAVHAYSELRFPLPSFASAFRSRVGLDRIVGIGGCARARVYVGSTSGKPAYESPLLVGSKKTVDTGSVALKFPPTAPRRLVLQADPVQRGSPPGADPLNIRDKLDWLDPRIKLDTSALQEQVRRRVGPVLAASPGWSIRADRRGACTWTSRLDKADTPGGRRFWTMLQTGAQPLSLRREMTIAPADKWLAVHLGLPSSAAPRSDTVTLRAGGRQVHPRKVPIRQAWQGRPAPLLFGLQEYQGKKITLELTQPAGGKPLHWHAVGISSIPPAAYRLVDIMEFVGKGDTKVSRELGLALQSGRITKSEKLAALEISQLGGVVNFRTEGTPDELVNVLVAADWTGGDKTFIKSITTFKKIPSLKMLLVTEKSGVSVGAIAKIQAEMPKLTIRRFVKRVPSPAKWVRCSVTWRNHTKKKVIALFINEKGMLQFSRWLEAGQVMHRPARVGYSYEAHYARKGFTHGEQFRESLPLTSFIVTDGGVWDIRP
ncbi:MAG: NPCBM/NEW2 domain-containing protein [Phycisphaerae bacterium]|jgi:hypothetical protein|nr:NPCBM/NEW2 domain-containing protein [Phycisphaerae bacterium]